MLGTSVVVEQVGQITVAVVVVDNDDDDGVSPAGSGLCNFDNMKIKSINQSFYESDLCCIAWGGGGQYNNFSTSSSSSSSSSVLFVRCIERNRLKGG